MHTYNYLTLFTNFNSVPFRVVQNEHVLFKKISRGFEGFDLPRNLHRRLRDLVRDLCQRLPVDRVGYNEGGIRNLRAHRYFTDFDFAALEERKLTPTFRPEVSGPADTKYARKPAGDAVEAPAANLGDETF